jgi:hypothetical protein
MKRLVTQWLGISLLLGCGLKAGVALSAPAPQHSGAPKTPEVIGRIHFAGSAQVNADPNGRVFKEVWKLPVTGQLRDEAIEKLAGALAARFQATNPNGSANASALLRAVLPDLCSAEFYAETIEHPQDLLETTLAIRLDENRRQVWEATSAKLLSGWKLRPASGPAHLSVSSTNGWFVVHCVCGASPAKAGDLGPNALLTRIRAGQKPVPTTPESWLWVTADLARWAEWTGLGKRDLPRVDLTLAGHRDYLRTQARLTFAEGVVPRVEKWDIPMQTLRDPLISFTAIQGFAPWLKKQPTIQELGLEKVPNQLYLWELSQSSFQLQAAVPVNDPTNVFQRLLQTWAPKFNRTLAEYTAGEVRPLTNRVELMWFGLPILYPYLNPVQEGNQGYLHAGIFPVNPPPTPPPPQLFQQLTTRTNLLYYDWEITQARLNQLRPLVQLSAVFLNFPPMSTNSNASKWLDAIEPRLGNSATEVSAASGRELNLVRTSHLGFNGLELLTLARWIDATNFPQPDLKIGFRPPVRSQHHKPAPAR